MRALLLLFVLISFSIQAQVGINTTTPKAILDIDSSSEGILIPRVALVQTKLERPVENPNGEVLENSTMVYNTATINDVRPGFYYWENDRWIRLNSEPQFMQFTTINLPVPRGVNDDVDFEITGTNYIYTVFRVLHGGADLSGIKDGIHGRVVYLYNGSDVDLKLLSENNSNSADINKFSLSGDVILKPGNAITIFYDGLYSNRWIVARSDN